MNIRKEQRTTKPPTEYTPLCYRCDHRARYLEGGYRPRAECGYTDNAKAQCYMYRPVRPVVLTKADPNDKRDVCWPAAMRARSRGLRVFDKGYDAVKWLNDDEYVILFKDGKPPLPPWRERLWMQVRRVWWRVRRFVVKAVKFGRT